MSIIKTNKRERRHRKIRAKVSCTSARPRLAVFRSNKHLYAQIINDEKGETLATATSREVGGKTLLEKAREIGKIIAKKAVAKKIDKVVFDRAGYVYTGKIKALAEGAREGGLSF